MLTPAFHARVSPLAVVAICVLDRRRVEKRGVVELGRMPCRTGHWRSLDLSGVRNAVAAVRSAWAQGYTAAVRKIAVGVGFTSLALAGLLAASVLAGPRPLGTLTDSTTSTTETTSTITTTETTPTTVPSPPAPARKPKPKPKPKKRRLARGITVGGVHVGGLTTSAALAAVRLAARSPLVVAVEDERVEVSPQRLGAKAYIGPAVSRALRSAPGTKVEVAVTVKGAAVRSWVAGLARKHDRELREAHVVLRDLKPRVVAERDGYVIRREATVAAVVGALRANRRGPIGAVARILHAKIKSTSFTSIIVIRRGSNRLMYFKGEKLARTFTVATGQSAYPTPLGNYRIVVMWRNPWWYPPPSPWAQGLHPVPPGPGNPLGTRWMGLSAPAVGIHGTPDAASLGYSASHGCIHGDPVCGVAVRPRPGGDAGLHSLGLMAVGLRRVGQALAIAVVLALLAVLAWRVVRKSDGGAAAAIRRGEHPVAPNFDLADSTVQAGSSSRRSAARR